MGSNLLFFSNLFLASWLFLSCFVMGMAEAHDAFSGETFNQEKHSHSHGDLSRDQHSENARAHEHSHWSHNHHDSGSSEAQQQEGHHHDHKHWYTKENKKTAEKQQASGGNRHVPEGVWFKALGATLVVCAAPVLILPFVPISDMPTPGNSKLLNSVLAFAAGGLLGDVFLHLLPHAMEPHSEIPGEKEVHSHSHNPGESHDHTHATVVGLWVLVGMLAFFILEKMIGAYHGTDGGHSHGHSHAPPKKQEEKQADQSNPKAKKGEKCADTVANEPEERHIEVSGYLNLLADFSHNFTDGLAIGVSYLAGESVGMSTTLAVLMHEVPHEVGDFAILIKSGFSRKQAMRAQLSTAIGALLGTCVGLMAKELADSTTWVLPLTAGGFIYIATVSVLPTLLHDCSLRQTISEVICLIAGVTSMLLIAFLE